MDCDFCAEFLYRGGTPDSTRIICEADGWLLLPTIGAFVDGYTLFMPVGHHESFAELGVSARARASRLLAHARRLVEATYGPVIIAEHGTAACDAGASCCAHLHLHLIPGVDPAAVLATYEAVGGAGRRIRGAVELGEFAGESYVYLSPRPGEDYVWPATSFSRQFVRRVCAAQLGMPDLYDWREYPFEDNMRKTVVAMRGIALSA